MWHAIAITQWNRASELHGRSKQLEAQAMLRKAAVALKRCVGFKTDMYAAHRDLPTVVRLMRSWGMHEDIKQLNLNAYVAGSDAALSSPASLSSPPATSSSFDEEQQLMEVHESIAETDAPKLPELQEANDDVISQAEQFFEAGYTQQAIQLLCHDDQWHVDVPPAERIGAHGALPPALARRAKILLRVCGVVLVRHAVPEHALRRLHSHVTPADAPSTVQPDGGVDQEAGVSSVPMDVLSNDMVVLNPWFMPIVTGGLRSSRLEIGHASLLPRQERNAIAHDASLAGASLSRDGHILPPTVDGFAHSVLQRRLQAAYGDDAPQATCQERARAMTHPQHGYWMTVPTSPAVGVHAVLPIGDAFDRRRIMTHVTPGSHIQCLPGMCSAEDESVCPHIGQGMLEVQMGPGDVLLVDSRLQMSPISAHWPTLALTLHQEWFKPSTQEPKLVHTDEFPTFSKTMQVLFARVDALKATQQAREDLQDLFVDVDELESQYEFDAYDYDESSFFADMDLTSSQYMRKMDPVIAGYQVKSEILEQSEPASEGLPHNSRQQLI